MSSADDGGNETQKRIRPRRKKESCDEKLIIALACGASVAYAARQAGVSEKTVARRMADPEFVGRLRRLRGEMLERAGGALVAAATKSVQTLLDLQHSAQPPATRLGAAKAVLDIGIRVRETLATNQSDQSVQLIKIEDVVKELSAGIDQATMVKVMKAIRSVEEDDAK